jgi:hypothetical protein
MPLSAMDTQMVALLARRRGQLRRGRQTQLVTLLLWLHPRLAYSRQAQLRDHYRGTADPSLGAGNSKGVFGLRPGFLAKNLASQSFG